MLEAAVMPRYHFVVDTLHRRHDDPFGTHLPDAEAARAHGHRIARELREGGFAAPGATMIVHDETGEVIHSIPI